MVHDLVYSFSIVVSARGSQGGTKAPHCIKYADVGFGNFEKIKCQGRIFVGKENRYY